MRRRWLAALDEALAWALSAAVLAGIVVLVLL